MEPQFLIAIICLVSLWGNGRTQETLFSRQVTKYGPWSPMELCPWGTYIVGMSLKSQLEVTLDLLGLTGLKLYCSQVPVRGPLSTNTAPHVTSGSVPSGEYGKSAFCPGAVFGFQLKVEPYQGPSGDDTGINNVRLLCDTGRHTTRMEGENGGPYGFWREVYKCPNGELLCGVQTQVDMDPSSDGTGLTNLNFQCCPILQPNENETETVQAEISNSVSYHKALVDSRSLNGLYVQTRSMQDLHEISPIWGQEVFCPLETGVIGTEVSRYSGLTEEGSVFNVITGLSFICGKWASSGGTKTYLSSASIEPTTNWTSSLKYCSERSVGTGLQLFLDPTTFNIERVDFLCQHPDTGRERHSLKMYEEFENELDAAELEFPSIQMEPMECRPGQFICSLQTQVFYNDDASPDTMGLKNIKMKCCEVPKGRSSGRFARKPKKLFKSERSVSEGKYILSTPIVSPANTETGAWDRCQSGSFLTGIALLHEYIKTDVTGLKAVCTSHAELPMNHDLHLMDTEGNSCDHQDFATGVQVKARPKYGQYDNVTLEILDIRLSCGDSPYLTNPDSSEQSFNPDITQEGQWMGVMECRKDEAICGVQTLQTGEVLPTIAGLKFECCELTVGLNQSDTSQGNMLKNKHGAGTVLYGAEASPPGIQKWSTWDYCSDDHYVSGFGTKRVSNNGPITGLRLLCQNPRGIEKEASVMETIGTSEFPNGHYLPEKKCFGGVGIGLQVAYTNRTMTGFRHICSWSKDERANILTEGSGEWAVQQKCPQRSTICGFQSLIGQQGLENVGIKCCRIPHPASVCIPTNEWELVTAYDNRNGTSSLQYTVSRRVGLTESRTVSEAQVREKSFAESLGYETGLSKERTKTVSTGTNRDTTSSNTNQINNEISTSQALANSMTKGSSDETSGSRNRGTDYRESDNTQVSNTRGVESSSSTSSGHTAGGSVSGGWFGISLSANYNYNTNKEERASQSSSHTHGSSRSRDSGRTESDTTSEAKSTNQDATDSKTKTWANNLSKTSGVTGAQSESTSGSSGTAQSESERNSRTKGTNAGVTDRIEWSKTDSRVWQEEVTESLAVEVLPRVKMEFYQAVGRCTFYEIRSKLFKRVDILAEGFSGF